MLDELCELCGYEHKHAIKVLGGKRSIGGSGRRRGGLWRGGGGRVEVISLGAEQPCGKRLKAAVPLWLPHYFERARSDRGGAARAALENHRGDAESAAGAGQGELGRGAAAARGRAQQIPVRTEHWDVAKPGAHCGELMACDFVWSVTLTDVHTQWTKTRAIWNRGKHAVCERIAEVEKALPFAILGFDSDAHSEIHASIAHVLMT